VVSSSAAEIRAEIEAKLAQSEESRAEIRHEARETAKKAAEYARGIAPVYHGPPRPDVIPGEFRDSIEVEDAPDHEGKPAARIISKSPIAHLLEYGTSKMPAAATFARTAAAFGGTPDGVTSK
jgi:hypothetical protein